MGHLSNILAAPIDWRSAATDAALREFLQDLQANILKGHGRFHTGHIFLTFKDMTPQAVAQVIRAVGAHCTSAYHQLRTNKKEPPHVDGGVVRCLFLSASGYKALGPLATLPSDPAFQAGMRARTSILQDPPHQNWSADEWNGPAPDAMILVADADPNAVTDDLEATENWINGTGAKILFVQRGLQQTRRFRQNAPAEGVEHFGYVDGRSQPLVLSEDVANEPHAKWSPSFPPSQFIVADPNGREDTSAGSYFVFRKLEQDVRGFNKAEDDLGRAIYGTGATQAQLDRAGAMVVGRFEDGTPLTMSNNALAQAVPNDFTYAQDTKGDQCPFHAHIRKTNPRGDIKRELGLPDETGDRAPIMIRRGITYGEKRPMNADGSEFADSGHEPQHHSGLLFMAYMADMEKQFEFVQQSWADNVSFAGNLSPTSQRPITGVDPIIGQSTNPADHDHFYHGGNGGPPVKFRFPQFVHLQGGEYFFAPSLSFLRGVGL